MNHVQPPSISPDKNDEEDRLKRVVHVRVEKYPHRPSYVLIMERDVPSNPKDCQLLLWGDKAGYFLGKEPQAAEASLCAMVYLLEMITGKKFIRVRNDRLFTVYEREDFTSVRERVA